MNCSRAMGVSLNLDLTDSCNFHFYRNQIQVEMFFSSRITVCMDILMYCMILHLLFYIVFLLHVQCIY